MRKGTFTSLKKQGTIWLDLTEPTEDELAEVCSHVGIDRETLGGWINGGKRLGGANLGSHSIMRLQVPVHTGHRKKTLYDMLNCTVLISHERSEFITIHHHPLPPIDEINSYSPQHFTELFRRGATALLHALLGEIVDTFHEAMDTVNEAVQTVENNALAPHVDDTILARSHAIKKSIIYFHRALVLHRDILLKIEHEHFDFIDVSMLDRFQSLSSSFNQLIEVNATYREILNTSMELYLTAISYNLNQTVKRVTGWGAIILIPTLITGFFGMNFTHMPIFDWEYGVQATLATMIFSVAILYWYFQKKDWM